MKQDLNEYKYHFLKSYNIKKFSNSKLACKLNEIRLRALTCFKNLLSSWIKLLKAYTDK